MLKALISAAGLAMLLAFVQSPTATIDGPEYTADGQMKLPANYREWIFLSAGLGMTYDPVRAASPAENPPFDNVFVSRHAYQAFMNSGKWPDKTVFILELRRSQSKGSINAGGHFQTGTIGIEAHVKDESRFAGKWAFFGFRNGSTTATQIPTTESCYSCHMEHGAVDTTFVQFYPTLIDAARKHGTMK